MNVKNIEKRFIYLSLIIGMIFMILTPPFQAPDENNHFKKAYVQHDVLLPDIADNNTCADDPEKIFIQQEEKEHVITALQRLSEAHRETVILRYYQDLKLDEIALVLNIPPGTVKSRLSNALRQLKKWLAKGAVTYNGNKTV